jgi:predicted nucleic acid-binding Zn ribbon protein
MVLRRTDTRILKDIITEVLRENGLDQKLLERSVISQWDEMVGRNVARSTQSVYVRDRKLFVTVRSAIIRNELLMIRDGLVAEFNRRAGTPLIDEIVFR